MPAVNLKEPGWTVHEGQAVWRLPKGAREIAGEVLVATRTDGRALVQFTKAPFPLVIAQETPHRWQVEFPPQNKHYAGRGKPPKRIIWLYLPRVLVGQPPPANWTWHEESSGWRLENHASGESLEGYFNQGSQAGRNSEGRNPKPERNPKAEIQSIPANISDFGFRPSFGLRPSDFGFTHSAIPPETPRNQVGS